MPGLNGTGPNGMGPMTGGARGYCNSGRTGPRRYNTPFAWSFGFPRWGSRRGMKGVARMDDLDMLRGETERLRAELTDLESRISQLSAREQNSGQ